MTDALPTPVLLYDQPRAPNPMRLNLFLAEKGVEIPRSAVDLMAGDHKTPDYLEKVGWPVCPALELSDGTVLTETVAIARYIEALHPEPNMLGATPLEQADIEMWQRRVEFNFWSSIAQCFRHTNPRMGELVGNQVQEWGEFNRDQIDGHLATLDKRLEGREWLTAGRMTIADITGYVGILFSRAIKYEPPEELKNLAAWRERIAARPSAAIFA